MKNDNQDDNVALLEQNVSNAVDSGRWHERNENRKEDRVDFRTTGLAYFLGDEGNQPAGPPIRIWTVDVSPMGCLLRSNEPITSKRLLLKLFLPQLKDKLIEAEIVRNLQDTTTLVNGKEKESQLYGVKFTKTTNLEDSDIELAPLESQPNPQPHVELPEETSTDLPQEKQQEHDKRVLTVIILAFASLISITLAIFT